MHLKSVPVENQILKKYAPEHMMSESHLYKHSMWIFSENFFECHNEI